MGLFNFGSKGSGKDVGKYVRVINQGENYSSYTAWFDKNAPKLRSRFTGQVMNGVTGVIRAQGRHSAGNKKTLYACEKSNGDIFLIGEPGVIFITAFEAKSGPTGVATPAPTSNKIGKTLKVTDTGKRYTTYKGWFETNAPQLLSRYRGENVSNGDTGIVRAQAPHSASNSLTLYACEKPNGDIFLINEQGVQFITPTSAPSYKTPTGPDIGKTVKVTDNGKRYPSYTSWFETNAPQLLSKFKGDSANNGDTGIVRAQAPHSAGNSLMCYACEKPNGDVFLIGAGGIQFVAAGTAPSYKELKGPDIGKAVKVTDSGKRYPSYTSWFETNAPQLLSKFKGDSANNGDTGIVRAQGPHSAGNSLMCYACEKSNGDIFLIGAGGISFIAASVGSDVGRFVKVTDSGKRYPSYTSWFEKNAPHLLSKFKGDSANNGDTGVVRAQAQHSAGNSLMCYACEKLNGDVFLIGAGGIEFTTASPNGTAHIGSTIKVIDTGKRYTTYKSWFETNAPHLLSRYRGENVSNGETGVVRAAAQHSAGNTLMLYACEKPNGDIFLINQNGIQVISSAPAPAPKPASSGVTGSAIGKVVKVTDYGKRYPSYTGWFETNAPHLLSKFKGDSANNGDIGTVRAQGPHSAGNSLTVYACEKANGDVFLIGGAGIEFMNLTPKTLTGPDLGKTVRVTDDGKRYPGYIGWFERNAPQLLANYKGDSANKGDTGVVRAQAQHSDGNSLMCYACEKSSGEIFLIGAGGIEFVDGDVDFEQQISVDCKVRVIDSGENYPNYTAWFTKNAPEYLSEFNNGDVDDGDIATVVAIGPFDENDSTPTYACKKEDGGVFLISPLGIEYVEGPVFDTEKEINEINELIDTILADLDNDDGGEPVTDYDDNDGGIAPSNDDLQSAINIAPEQDEPAPIVVNEPAPAPAAEPVRVPLDEIKYTEDKENGEIHYDIDAKFNVGARVKVVDSWQNYMSYEPWLEKYSPDSISKFVEECEDGEIATVVARGCHLLNPVVLYACENSRGKVFIISEGGIELAE